MREFLKTQLTQSLRLIGWSTRQCWLGIFRLTQLTTIGLRQIVSRAWQYPRTTGAALGLVVTGTVCQLLFSGAMFPETADVSPSANSTSDEMTGMDGQLISVLPDVEPAKLETDFPMTALVPNTVTPPAMPEFDSILPVASSDSTAAPSDIASQDGQVSPRTYSQFGTPPWSQHAVPEYRPDASPTVAVAPAPGNSGSAAWLTGTIESNPSRSQSKPRTQTAGPWGNPQAPQRN